MTGRKSFKERENEEKLGKKKYLERRVQDQEAEEEIKEYLNEDCTDESGTNRLDGQRPIGRECR
jgi:hypothetical protein